MAVGGTKPATSCRLGSVSTGDVDFISSQCLPGDSIMSFNTGLLDVIDSDSTIINSSFQSH
jgi:hypothetical protein